MAETSFITATYLIETAEEPELAAASMAGEQSTGTFLRLKNETDELRAAHAAETVEVIPLEEIDRPSLSGSSAGVTKRVKRARVKLRWPYVNVGTNLSNLCATIAGNLFELRYFSGLKLLDFDVPDIFLEHYPGPQFGIEGTRRLIPVFKRPIIGTIIKPSVGLTPSQTAHQVSTLIEAGLDFIKDDELMGDSPHSPFEQRLKEAMNVINRYADKSGKKPMYAFNISGDMDDMLRRHDAVVENGGTCVMASVNWTGVAAIEKLRRHSQLPIHAHRNGWGMFNRHEVLGMEFPAFQKIWRLAGVDHLHTNGLRNKFCESDASVVRSAKACLASFLGKPGIMPVISSGQWAGQIPDTYDAIHSQDFMYVCGGGIVGHPQGIAAGVESIKQAWEATQKGVSLEDFSVDHPELKTALEFYE